MEHIQVALHSTVFGGMMEQIHVLVQFLMLYLDGGWVGEMTQSVGPNAALTQS